MQRKNLGYCALLLCTVGACSADKRAESPHRRKAATSVVETSPVPSRLPLAQRLEQESSTHPESVRRVHDLLEGLARESLFVRTRQVLALPVGADYCRTAVSSSGVGVSVCAFGNAASARAGAQRSRQLFDRLIPNRTLIVQEDTLLTLSSGADSAAQHERARLAALFPTLTKSADNQTAFAL